MIKKILALVLTSISVTSSFAYSQTEIDEMYMSVPQKCTMAYSMALGDVKEKNFKELEETLKKYENLENSSKQSLVQYCYLNINRIMMVNYESDKKSGSTPPNERVEDTLKKWKLFYPNSLYAHLFLADVYMSKAWDDRGEGFAKNVESKRMQNFHEKMKESDGLLNQVEKEGLNSPVWYSSKIITSAILNPPDFFGYSLDALQKFPMDMEVYSPIVTYSKSKWLGKPNNATIEDLGQFAIKNFSKETGKIVYSKLYQTLGNVKLNFVQTKDEGCPICKSDRNPPLMNKELEKQGTDIILNKYPTPYHHALYFKAACFKNDNKRMKELYPKVKGLTEIKDNRVNDYLKSEEWQDCLKKGQDIK